MKKAILLALALVIQASCFASGAYVLLDTNIVKEGGILKIKIGSDKPIKAADIYFDNERYTAFFKQFDIRENQFVFTSIIPVPLGTKGRKTLDIKYMLADGGEHEKKEKITVKALKARSVNIETGMVNDELEAELKAEGKIIYKYQDAVTPVKYDFPFIMPVDAEISGGFGDKRVYDGGKAEWRHKGLDIAGKKGAPVRADNNGVVASASSTKAYGNIIILDHGAGVYSMFFHMKKLYVKKGDKITKGDVIGTVGDSGLSTGPHLHWQVNVFKKPVNPMEFMGEF